MIVVSPLHEMDHAVARWSPSHVVSLLSPAMEHPRLPASIAHLRLTFHDIAEPRTGLTAPTESDIGALLAFAKTSSVTRPLLIHCWAGVSRSPAAAYIVACSRTPPGEEQVLADELRRAAPFATPNRRVIALADDLLSRHGAMSDAIQRIGRGAEAFSGSTFTLDIGDA